MAMKYAITRGSGKQFWADKPEVSLGYSYFKSGGLAYAKLFDSPHDAMRELGEFCRTQGDPFCIRDVRIVAVEETPEDTKRELVELSGVVDHGSLDGYVVRMPGDPAYFVGAWPMVWGGRVNLVDDISKAHIFGSLGDVALFIQDYHRTVPGQIANHAHLTREYEIVGVREVTSPPRRVAYPLIPDTLNPINE